MKRFLVLPVLVLVAALSFGFIGNESGVTRWSYGSHSVTSTAATITLAVPLTANTSAPPRMLRLKAPSNNTDLVRLDPILATATSFPMQPGEVVEVPYTSQTMSVKSDSGTQTIQILVMFNK